MIVAIAWAAMSIVHGELHVLTLPRSACRLSARIAWLFSPPRVPVGAAPDAQPKDT